MNLPNFHTHSTFCDGKDTLEDTVKQAIAFGCPALGFSGHGHTAFDDSYCMSLEKTSAYRAQIAALKEAYADQICIFCGLEQDVFSTTPTVGYDYVIGAVHYFYLNGRYYDVDGNVQTLLQAANEVFAGDIYALCEEYYRTVATVYERTHCQIIAHFDLITKFNEQIPLIDTAHPRYRRAVLQALDALCDTPALFEVNTGAIARGYRTSAYPEPWILQEIGRRTGKPFVITSDCHKKEYLQCHFSETAALLESLGLPYCRTAEEILQR